MSFPWPKLKRDWIGRRARTLRPITNGYGTLPKGRVVIIRDYYRGCAIRTVRAPHNSISRVEASDLELLPKK